MSEETGQELQEARDRGSNVGWLLLGLFVGGVVVALLIAAGGLGAVIGG